MQFELKVDPAAIEQQVTKAIVESAFGAELAKSIQLALKNINSQYSSWYNEGLTKVIEAQMREIIRTTIEKDHAELIKQKVAEFITPDVVSTTVQRVTNKILEDLKLRDY